MNIIYNRESIEELRPFLEVVSTYSNPPTKEDGPIKWASILEALDIFEPLTDHQKNILDIGAGNSALPLMLYDYGFHVRAIDNRDLHPQVKASPDIQCYIGDAFSYLETLPDSSLDYAVDSCAVIHFETTSNIGYNDGLVKISQLLSKKLKIGGKFVMVSDFSMDHTMGEFICSEHIIEDIELGGLELYGKWHDYPDPKDRFNQNYNEYQLGIIRLVFERVA